MKIILTLLGSENCVIEDVRVVMVNTDILIIPDDKNRCNRILHAIGKLTSIKNGKFYCYMHKSGTAVGIEPPDFEDRPQHGYPWLEIVDDKYGTVNKGRRQMNF